MAKAAAYCLSNNDNGVILMVVMVVVWEKLLCSSYGIAVEVVAERCLWLVLGRKDKCCGRNSTWCVNSKQWWQC